MKIFGIFISLSGMVILLIGLSLLLMLTVERPRELPCEVTTRDGVLQFRGEWLPEAVLVGKDEPFVLSSGGARPRGPVPIELLRRLATPGLPLHLEFCGSDLVRMASNSGKVLEITRDQAENNAKIAERNMAILAIIGLLICFAGKWLAAQDSTKI